MRNDVNELEPKIDLDLYKNRLKIQNQELEKKEERIKKFKIVFEQLSEETSKDTIKELINSVMN
ncbi:MAG: hypothetical protein P1U46_04835 [Patescibacteria group bacterium]|nr:hypothetical protein [Patescibacteria group bacterium]